jgi:hypothetical protein
MAEADNAAAEIGELRRTVAQQKKLLDKLQVRAHHVCEI